MCSLSPRVTGAVLELGLSWHVRHGFSHQSQWHAGRLPFMLGRGHFLPRPFRLIVHCPFDTSLELLPAVKIRIVNCGLWHRAVLVGCYTRYGDVQATAFVFTFSPKMMTVVFTPSSGRYLLLVATVVWRYTHHTHTPHTHTHHTHTHHTHTHHQNV